MRLITKLWATLLLLCVVGVANAAKEYEVDQRFDNLADLLSSGQLFSIVNETDAKGLCFGFGDAEQNMYYETYADMMSSKSYTFKVEAAEGEDVAGYYYLRPYKPDGTLNNVWGWGGYFNSQPVDGWCDFCLGLNNQNGQDLKNGAVWAIEANEGKFALKNIGTGKYLKDAAPAKYDEPTYFTFCSLKEKPSLDPLAEYKDALEALIAKGQMFNALAYTDASFSALTSAVSAGETALAATDATAESLTGAATAITEAIAALALKDGFTNLTADLFFQWNSATEPTTSSATGCDYTLFVPTGMVFGNSSVALLTFADLSAYDKLYVTVANGTPRILLNRDVNEGQWSENEAESHLIDNTKGGWSAKYFTTENGVTTVDLKQLVADKGFAHLHSIKGSGNVTVTGLYLYKEAAAPSEMVAFDWVAGDQNYTNAQDLDGVEIALDAKTTMTCTKGTGSNGPKYYTSGSAVRTYGGNVITFKGEGITKIVITGVNGKVAELTASTGELTTEGIVTTWKGEANEIVLSNTTSNQQHIAKLHVVYGGVEEDVEPVHIANTIDDPYTVAKAVELIDAGDALDETVFVKGIISKIDSVNTELGFITYWISDDGTTASQQFECYKGKTMEGLALADIEVGAEVIVTGKLTKYNEIYEFAAGNTIAAYVAPVKPLFADGKYYILNKGTQKYLAAGANWGTHAIVNADGLDYAIAFADGKYTLDSNVSNGGNSHFLNGEWNDGNAMGWIFTPVEGAEGLYTISNGTQFLTAGEDGKVTLGTDATVDAAQWSLKTLEARIAELATATAEAPVNATFLIQDANFGRNDLRKSAWTMVASNQNLSGGEDNSGSVGNNCAESYHSTFTLSQVLANAPAGKYKMTAQGFYRQDGSDNDNLPVFYANDKTATFSLKTGSENSMTDASKSFSAGNYTIEPIEFTVFEDGQLTVGAKLENNTNLWCIFDNFRLTYLSKDIPADEFKPAYEAALAAAQAALENEAYTAVTGEERTALQTAISSYENLEEATADTYKEAISALTTATSAFTAAKADYEALIAAKNAEANFDFTPYPYASQDKIAAAQATLTAEATSAADAKAKTQGIFNAFRKAVESNAMLESIPFGVVNHSDSIAGANADQNTGWTSGSIGTNQGQGYTDGDGVVCGKYLDGGWSGSAGANIDLVREVNLPAGKFILTATARGSADLTEYTMTIAGQTVELPHIGAGANDGVFGNGWNDAFVVFETTGEPVQFEIKATSTATQQWVSINRFRIAQFAEAGDEDPVLEAPEGWINMVANGNLATDNVTSFVAKEAPSDEILGARIVAMAGKNNSRGIIVKSADEVGKEGAQAWDTQFWIKVNEPLASGSKLHVEFDYRASQAAKATTQAHGAPGAYQHWAAIGDVNFTTEWQHFSADITVDDAMAKGDNGNGTGEGLLSIAFNLAEEKSATEYYFDNFGVWAQKPVIPDSWTDLIVNGNMDGEENTCFYVTEQGVGGPFVAKLTAGIGKDGSKAVKVQSADDVTDDTHEAQDWDSQFFIRLPYQLPAGTKFKVSFDYKADKAGDFDTQAHANPGQYIHWACCGSGSFTTEWQTYEKEGTVPAECDGSSAQKTFQTIAFNLAKNRVATEFVFDNVKFEVPSDIVSSLTLNPDENPQLYPDDVDGIQTVKVANNGQTIYNLNGQKMNKAQKGLYIINGKKVVLK